MTTPDIPTEALEAAARKLFEHDRMPDDPPWDDVYEADRDSYRNAVQAVVAAAAPHLIAEGRRQAIEETERRGSRLCDCDDLDDQESPPTNPRTGARMDHHCDCLAVNTAAAMLGAYSATKHARECGHGTEMDHV